MLVGNNIILGLICGLIAGIVAVLIMLPLPYETRQKKIEAICAAFLERFMIGLLIPTTTLGLHPIVSGLFISIMLSIPSALITRVYLPILGNGVIEGIVIGFVVTMMAG